MKYWRKEQAAENNGVHIVEVTVSSKADTITIPHGLNAAPSKVILREKAEGGAGDYAPIIMVSDIYGNSTNGNYDLIVKRGYLSSNTDPPLQVIKESSSVPLIVIDDSNVTFYTRTTTYYFNEGAVYELVLFE